MPNDNDNWAKRIHELTATNNSLVDTVRGLRDEVGRLRALHNADKQHYMGIAQATQATNAELVGALSCCLADLEGIMPQYAPDWEACPGWQSIKDARAALAKAKGTGGDG